MPWAVASAVALWSTRSFWLPGRYVSTFDSFTYSGPNLEVTTAAARSWGLALWNDAIFGGVTHLGNPQTGTLYPPRLLALVVETNRAMGVLVALHVVLLGLGLVALSRRLGFGVVAATFAGVAGVLSGAVLTKAAQFEQILVLAWAPWLLVALHATIETTRPWRAVAGLAAVTAATLLAGHPQMVYETVFLATAAVVGFMLTARRWARLPYVAAGVALGALIAAPQLVAALVATRESSLSGGRPLAELRVPDFVVDRDGFATALLGTVLDRGPGSITGSFERDAFVGVGVALLATIGLVDALRQPDRRWWAIALAAVGALALVWAQGPSSLLFRGAVRLVPGFDLGRVSARWLVVVALVAIVLAAAGIDAVVHRPRREHAIVAGVTVLVGAGVLVVGQQYLGEAAIGVWWAITAMAIVASIVVIVLASGSARTGGVTALGLIVGLELVAMSLHSLPERITSSQPFSDQGTTTTEWLRIRRDDGSVIALTDDGQPADYSVPGLRPNANVLNGIRSIDGYDGGLQVTTRWATALRRFRPGPDATLPLRNALAYPLDPNQLARLGVRYALIALDRPADELVPDWIGPVVTDERFGVWENPAYVGEAIAWPSARAVAARERAADVLRDEIDELSSTALVPIDAKAFECDPVSACRATAVAIERRSPGDLTLVSNAEQRTLVSVAQQYSPGWHASIDGEAAPLVEVDGLFLGVDVPAGGHTIELTYRPPWLTASLVVATMAMLATIALAVLGGRRRPAATAT